jgi:hypothetical protein
MSCGAVVGQQRDGEQSFRMTGSKKLPKEETERVFEWHVFVRVDCAFVRVGASRLHACAGRLRVCACPLRVYAGRLCVAACLCGYIACSWYWTGSKRVIFFPTFTWERDSSEASAVSNQQGHIADEAAAFPRELANRRLARDQVLVRLGPRNREN